MGSENKAEERTELGALCQTLTELLLEAKAARAAILAKVTSFYRRRPSSS